VKSVARTACLSGAALLVAFVAIAIPSGARAQESAKIEVLVASVATSGNQIDGPLRQMAADFKRNGLAFTSYRLVSRTSLALRPGASGAVPLPEGRAQITYVRRDPDGKLRVKVSAPGTSSELSMSPGGEAYIDAGSHGGGKLFLVVRR
jgi:hypothetical protein